MIINSILSFAGDFLCYAGAFVVLLSFIVFIISGLFVSKGRIPLSEWDVKNP